MIKLIKAASIIILVFLPLMCSAKRTISGRITDKSDNPVSGARVRAFDHDLLSGDDLMGVAFTDGTGHYTITYDSRQSGGGRWDTKWPFLTTWRPNIYIKVSMRTNGRCDDGEWNAVANWQKLGESRPIHSNHRMSRDLTINFKAHNFPEDNVVTVTLTECVNMICNFNFFFHYSCLACYDDKKIEWSDWGGSIPYSKTRCVDLSVASECSQRDRNDINNECNNRILDGVGAASGARALQENCVGTPCGQLRYIASGKAIIIVNESEETMELKFKCKPFKNWKKMHITQYLNSNDSILVPPINYRRLKAKTYKLREN